MFYSENWLDSGIVLTSCLFDMPQAGLMQDAAGNSKTCSLRNPKSALDCQSWDKGEPEETSIGDRENKQLNTHRIWWKFPFELS